jgi:hypothetical protein
MFITPSDRLDCCSAIVHTNARRVNYGTLSDVDQETSSVSQEELREEFLPALLETAGAVSRRVERSSSCRDGRRRVASQASSGRPVLVAVFIAVVVILFTAVAAVIVGAMFVWAARKDGEEDVALQKKLGRRRRTRL